MEKTADNKNAQTASKRKASVKNNLSANPILSLPVSKAVKELNKDRLDNLAVITETGEYTYRQMFNVWDKYARVFSTLNICKRNGSRVCIIYPKDFNSACTFFALNMIGVSVSFFSILSTLDINELKEKLKKEKITDIITVDHSINPNTAFELIKSKNEIGLRNLIIIKDSIYRYNLSPAENIMIDANFAGLCMIPELKFMDDLLYEYGNAHIDYDDINGDDVAAIFHTSGTTKGITKPIPFTNRQLNHAAGFVLYDERFKKFEGRARMIVEMELSHMYFFVDEFLVSLFLGCTAIFTFKGAFSQSLRKDIEKYGVNVWISSLMCILGIVESQEKADLSKVELVITGGSSVSGETKERINNLLSECGCNAKLLVGYGLSEAGCACILCNGNETDGDSVGYPLPGVNVKIQDEDTKEFFDITDGERIGGLYISSESISYGNLDGERYFPLTEIDGQNYICTNDLFRVNSDGSLSCCGRMNNFFVNNEGIRFDAGLIETEISNEPGIKHCVILPFFNKIICDTIPIAFIEISSDDQNIETVRKALINTFINKKINEKTNLPAHIIIVDHMPIGQTGKIDRRGLDFNNENYASYSIVRTDTDGRLSDIKLIEKQKVKDDAYYNYVPVELKGTKTSKNMDDLISDPEVLFSLPPSVFQLFKYRENLKRRDSSEEKKSAEQLNPIEFINNIFESFPCNQKEWGFEGSPFTKCMFPFSSEKENSFSQWFAPYFEKPKLSHEDVEMILDHTQEWLSFFYEAEKVKYIYKQ